MIVTAARIAGDEVGGMRWLELSLGSICELWELVARMLRENIKAEEPARC